MKFRERFHNSQRKLVGAFNKEAPQKAFSEYDMWKFCEIQMTAHLY